MNEKNRTSLNEAFPKGWWRSRRWWAQAISEQVLFAVTLFATVLRLGTAVRAVRDRRRPERLARIDGEAFTYALLGNGGSLALLIWVASNISLPVLPALSLGGFFGLNTIVAALVVTVLVVSKLWRRTPRAVGASDVELSALVTER